MAQITYQMYQSLTPEQRSDWDRYGEFGNPDRGGLVSLLDPTGEVREPRQTLADKFPDFTGPKTIAEQQGGATLGGADLTPEFQRYIESQGYNVQGHPMMADAGPLITKDGKDIFGALTQTDGEWGFKDTEPFRGPKPGEPGFGDIDKWMPEYPDEPIPPRPPSVMPRPGGELPLVNPLGPSPHTRPPPVMPRPGGVMPRPGLIPTGPNLVPRPDPSLNPFQPSVPEVQPPSPSVSPRPEPKPGIQFPQLPTGQQVSNLAHSEGPALRPPSLRLKHGGSLTDKVSRILRNLL